MGDGDAAGPPAVLIFRPFEEARRTAAKCVRIGLRPIISPLLRYERTGRLTPPDLIGVQATVFTSGAAAFFAAKDAAAGPPVFQHALLLGPAYCVGDATSARAAAQGYATPISAGGDAADLERALGALDPAKGAVLHIRGEHVARRLTAGGGLEVRERILYAARRNAPLSAEAIAALGGSCAALVHSRRISEIFAEELVRIGCGAPEIFAMSPRAAAPLQAPPARSVRIADRPNEAALLDQLQRWFYKNRQKG
ncbi:MAG: uroporphyrinogen-III synthase [Neomegalonema sp.]|nr:uroporphyrinogen-III synthase [Neomegalonema sp.]